jgi:hypothetical protein
MSARRIAVTALVVVTAVLGFLAFREPSGTQVPPQERPPAPRTAPADGPAAVAIRFLSGLDLARLLDDKARRRFIAGWAAPGHASGLQALYAAEADRVRAAYSARPRIARAAFLGYRVDQRDAGRGEVAIWAVSVGGAGASAVAVGWRTMRVSLSRSEDAWKVVGVREAPGPSPDMPVAEFATAAGRFEGLRVAP